MRAVIALVVGTVTGACSGSAPRPAPGPAQRALNVVTEGIPGTPMPSWKSKFGDNERQMLADYVRSFYEER